MYYINYVTINGNTKTTVAYKTDDNIVWWLGDGEQDAGYLAWLAEGNEPQEWQPEEAE